MSGDFEGEKKMGTTCFKKPDGMPLFDFMKRELRFRDDLPHKYTYLEMFYKAPAIYAAIEKTCKETGQSEVFAEVIKISRHNGMICYKPMSESMFPYYFDCPAKILDMLTPTDNEESNKWREGCRENLKKARERKNIAPGYKLRYGDKTYKVISKIGRGYFEVEDDLGNRYKMKPRQVRDSEILQ
jgi:NDP-sugar pyrophosphorylase family protein